MLAAVLAVCLMAGCMPVRYTRWYKANVPTDQSSDYNGDITALVKVKAFALPSEPTLRKSLWDLSPEGQAAYIETVGGKAADLSVMGKALSGPVGSEVSRKVDLTTFKKRLVISVQNLCDLPANRISSLEITFDLGNQPARFLSWDKLETKYSTVDLGKVTNTSGSTFELTPGIELLGDVVGTQAGKAGWSNSVAEEVGMNRRFVEVTGVLEKTKGTLLLEGMPGRDLEGNIIVEMTLEAESKLASTIYSTDALFDAGGAAVDQAKVTVTGTPLVIPQGIQSVSLAINYNACLRLVTNQKGAKSILEGDDRIRFNCTNAPVAVTPDLDLVASNEVDVLLWVIKWDDKTLHVRKPDGAQPAVLAFATQIEAVDFQKWLKVADMPTVGGFDLVDGAGVQLVKGAMPTTSVGFIWRN